MDEFFEETPSQKRAREIMGKNFFGVKEAINFFGVSPTKEQLVALAEIHSPETLFEQYKDTHILVAVFPLSIHKIRKAVKCRGRGLFHYGAFFPSTHSDGCDGVGWRLVRKTPVDNSRRKSYDEQKTLLGSLEYVPSLQLMVYTIIGHFLSTGEWLFNRQNVRVSTRNAYYQMFICSSWEGIYFGECNSWEGYPFVGVSSARL